MFEKLKSRYIIKGKIVMDTGLHIGSGEDSFETDALVIKDAHGKPYIPGSSFKGILRSTVERIVPNLDGFRTCALIKGANCATVNEAKKDQFKARLEGDEEGNPLDLICDTCKLFGSTVVSSKIKIPDLYVSEPWVESFEKRDGVGIDRDTETAVEGVKFDYEVVPSQTCFELEMIGENLDERDNFLLALGLGEMQSGMVTLGGNKSRGLGAFRLVIEEVAHLDFENKQSLVNYLTSQELKKIEPSEFVKECLKTFLKGGEDDA
jgi:CRISPR-associated RAMP protein (TIGR02581 family)